MSVELLSFILLSILFLLLAVGAEVAVAIGVAGSLGLLLIGHAQIEVAWMAWGTLNSPGLLAMPLFIFMGAMLGTTGAIKSLFEGAEKWIGGLPGGMANSVIAGCAVFGAMSGSSVAAAAIFSKLSFPEMEKRGYDHKLAFGSIAVGGTISVLIPPSIFLIIYGIWEGYSIAKLFAAAIIPGLLLTTLLMLTVIVMVKLDPRRAPKSPPAGWRERIVSIKTFLLPLGVIVLVLGVIFGGVMTATEASALGAFLSVVVAILYGQFSYKNLMDSCLDAVRVGSMITFVFIAAKLLSFVFAVSGFTDQVSAFILNLSLGKYGTLAVFCVMYLILGMFIDAASMLVLTTPFVVPIIESFGLSPIWWGVVYVILAEVGLITPPFGLNLFTIRTVVPQYSIFTIASGSLPFMIPLFVTIVIIILFPQLALWLPDLLY